MRFIVVDKGDRNHAKPNTVILTRDLWDDYRFKTAFHITYIAEDSRKVYLGWVKIAYLGMKESNQTFDKISKEFSSLDDSYYSLGQSIDYYNNLKQLGDFLREQILLGLNDIAINLERLKSVRSEEAFKISLIREMSITTIEEQFFRVANGGSPLTRYEFTYSAQNGDDRQVLELQFIVNPHSMPPTNLHALIGPNGTGKTTILKDIVHTIYNPDNATGKLSDSSQDGRPSFANLIFASYSPFENADDLIDLLKAHETDQTLPCAFIGLDLRQDKLPSYLNNQFQKSLERCLSSPHKTDLLKKSIHDLNCDPIFSQLETDRLIYSDEYRRDFLKSKFPNLSSGHKAVISIITGCVAYASEKCLVLIDEPENHLHPPLLSALIRILGNLLINQNGVAIIATHSPIVLQEIPRRCVWKLRSTGSTKLADRPTIQTFGANTGTLTAEVFGHEVNRSGFHKLIKDAVNSEDSFEDVSRKFNNELGDEAKFLALGLMALKVDDANA